MDSWPVFRGAQGFPWRPGWKEAGTYAPRALLAGCRNDAVEYCFDLSKAGRHEAAAEACAKAYQATGNPRTGDGGGGRPLLSRAPG